MLVATLHVDLDRDHALSGLAEIHDRPFSMYQFEVLAGDTIRFLIKADEHRDAIATYLHQSPAVDSLENVAKSQLLVTKRSSGIVPILRKNHGMLQQMSQFHGTVRVIDVIVYNRDDLKSIMEELQELGSVQLKQLKPFGDPASSLSSRQAEVLELAYNAGYYDWPRPTDAETLAGELDISHATFLEHLRKAERKIMDEALGGAAPTPEIPHEIEL
ncbi:helix-turn-helix domain-containing protein [Halococcus hamelinensis]|uniref:Bacterio-opsin activator-like protein n=1 Tax=Halococcus hamelinensis 100A6 TaxID=1132509 RepID=M0LTL6_9EURY|nr:helix-turn-helix domain-containing protein [Halococcus hamelinensis]EMA36786.1 bacterio-opsin activator-like protein [Halococcus hamelinensis 100A6]